MARYLLMNKNIVMAVLGTSAGYTVIVEQYTDLPHWMKNIEAWLLRRYSPIGMSHIAAIVKEAKLDSLTAIIEITHAISLNDTVWIKGENEVIDWDSVNPYRNSFNNKAYAAVFQGHVKGLSAHDLVGSPMFTTGGSFIKSWKRADGTIMLNKRSDYKGVESESEYLCCQVAHRLGLRPDVDYVDYSLRYDEYGQSYSRCKCFCNEGVSLVTAFDLFGDAIKDPRNILKYMDNMQNGELYRYQLVLDYLTYNTDRHGDNYGMLVDSATFKPFAMAPIFDNNLALLSQFKAYKLLDTGRYEEAMAIADSTLEPHGVICSFESQASWAINRKILKGVMDVANHLELSLDSKKNSEFSEERLKGLTKIVRARAKSLIETVINK